MDNMSVAHRSYTMSRIRSKGNTTTELRLAALLREAQITGWRRQARLLGRPDFAFLRRRVLVFVDGCFWHGCSSCRKSSQNASDYWTTKLAGTVARDRRNTRALRADGWSVIRIWEHELRADPARSIARIRRLLARADRKRAQRTRAERLAPPRAATALSGPMATPRQKKRSRRRRPPVPDL